MELLPVTVDWILFLLINLIVPGIVWVTVIAGLIMIVRDKAEEDDLVEHWARSEPPTCETPAICGAGRQSVGSAESMKHSLAHGLVQSGRKTTF